MNKVIIIKESLKNNELPISLKKYHSHTYPYKLDGKELVEIIVLFINNRLSYRVGWEIAELLHPTDYFAHILANNYLLIIFPNCVTKIEKGNYQNERRCKEIGALFNIPLHQMRFMEFFIKDHPDEQ